MDKYTDFTHPNQPKSSNQYQRHQVLKDTEDHPLFIDSTLRILLHRMLQNAAPPADTWSKILKRACSLNPGGSD